MLSITVFDLLTIPCSEKKIIFIINKSKAKSYPKLKANVDLRPEVKKKKIQKGSLYGTFPPRSLILWLLPVALCQLNSWAKKTTKLSVRFDYCKLPTKHIHYFSYVALKILLHVLLFLFPVEAQTAVQLQDRFLVSLLISTGHQWLSGQTQPGMSSAGRTLVVWVHDKLPER